MGALSAAERHILSSNASWPPRLLKKTILLRTAPHCCAAGRWLAGLVELRLCAPLADAPQPGPAGESRCGAPPPALAVEWCRLSQLTSLSLAGCLSRSLPPGLTALAALAALVRAQLGRGVWGPPSLLHRTDMG